MHLIQEMFSYPFMQRAFVVGILVSLCAALLGPAWFQLSEGIEMRVVFIGRL